MTRHDSCQVSPFGHPGITARLTAPPGLSRPPTSFIGSWCQGIHRLLSATSQQRCSRPLCNSQTTTNPTNRTATTHPPPNTTEDEQFDDRPGPEPRTQTRHRALVPSGPNRMPAHQPPAAPRPRSPPPKGVVLTDAGRCRPPASPVSPPTSTPPTHAVGAGS